MKYTLLQMVQSVLSSMNSDLVNSIGDTEESLQVAEIVRQTYFNMIGRYDLPEHNQLVQLIPSQNEAQPVLMTRPEATSRIEWVKYYDTNPNDGAGLQSSQFGAYSHGVNTELQNNANGWSTSSTTSNTIGTGSFTFTVGSGLNIQAGSTAFVYSTVSPVNNMHGTVISYTGSTLVLNITSSTGSGTFTNWTISQNTTSVFGPGYLNVQLLPIDDFINETSRLNLADPNVGSFELAVTSNATGHISNYIFKYRTDRQPTCCAVLSNYFVIFDSYDNTQDSTLQANKTMAMAWLVPQFNMNDSFIPELDEQQIPLFLNECKSLAFFELKQQTHEKAEQEVERQVVSLQKWKAISGKPTYFQELPDFGRRGGGWTSAGAHWKWLP